MSDTYVWIKGVPGTVVQEDAQRVQVLLHGRKRAAWVSKTQLQQPKRVVMTKSVNFDQECGCTAVAELEGNKVTCYNIYGNVKKYFKAGDAAASKLSHHHQRVHLAEEGYTRARSRKSRTTDSSAKEAYHLLSKKAKGKDGKVRSYEIYQVEV